MEISGFLSLATTYLYIPKNRSIYSNTSSIVSPHWFYSSFFRTINVKKKGSIELIPIFIYK